MKQNKIMKCVGKQMDLENNTVSEVNLDPEIQTLHILVRLKFTDPHLQI